MAYEVQTCWFEFFASFSEGLLEGVLTCNLKFGEHCILDKKMKVKFGTIIHRSEDLLDCAHADVRAPTKNASFGGHRYFVAFIKDLSRRCWVYPMRQI